MKVLQLIDIDVALPAEIGLERRRTPLCRWHYRLVGDGLALLREQIESSAMRAGFSLERSEKQSWLRRRDREQWIALVAVSPTRLDITVEDVEALPPARVTEEGIAVNGLELRMPGLAIKPRRERAVPELKTWIGEWEIAECEPSSLSALVLDALRPDGFSCYGPFGIRDASTGDTWTSEASNSHALVKIHATSEAGDKVILSIEVIRS